MPDGLNGGWRRSVLLTTDAVGGVWRYTLDLARGFIERDVPVTIAVVGPAPTPAQLEEACGMELVSTGLALDWTADSPAALTASVEALRTLAMRLGAASAHLHAPALAGAVPWGIPLVTVAHSCVATWWKAVRGGPLPADFFWRMQAAQAGFRIADAVIAPTRAHADAVQAVYGPIPIHVVHNGATLPEPTGRAERDRVVLTAGRLWDEAKNVAVLDRFAPELGVPIRAAGPTAGPNGAAIALPNLELLGPLDPNEMARAYARATVFASLATYEPFGLSVLEAALSGMRLVLSDIPSFRELWDGAATFVASEAALLPALQSALAQQPGGAQERARRYTLAAMAEATLAVHRRVGALI